MNEQRVVNYKNIKRLIAISIILLVGTGCEKGSRTEYVPGIPKLSKDASCGIPYEIKNEFVQQSISAWVDEAGQTLEIVSTSYMTKDGRQLYSICGQENGDTFIVEQALLSTGKKEDEEKNRVYVCTGKISWEGKYSKRKVTISLQGPHEDCQNLFSGTYTYPVREKKPESDKALTSCQVWVDCACAIDAAGNMDFSVTCKDGRELLKTDPINPACDQGLSLLEESHKAGLDLPKSCLDKLAAFRKLNKAGPK